MKLYVAYTLTPLEVIAISDDERAIQEIIETRAAADETPRFYCTGETDNVILFQKALVDAPANNMLDSIKNAVMVRIADCMNMSLDESPAKKLVDVVTEEAYYKMRLFGTEKWKAAREAMEAYAPQLDAERLRQQVTKIEGWKDCGMALMDPQPKQTSTGFWELGKYTWVGTGWSGFADILKEHYGANIPEGADIRPTWSGVWYWVWEKDQPEEKE